MIRRPVAKPAYAFEEGKPRIFRVVAGTCIGYTEPPDVGGWRTGEHWHLGETFAAVASKDCGEFVAVLTTSGSWTNVWRLRNKSGNPVGVHFARPSGD